MRSRTATKISPLSAAAAAAAVAVVILVLAATSTRADDWPQWMGPRRDNVWRESGLLKSFPKGGPKIVWRAPVAGGFAGPAVAGGRVVVTDYSTRDEAPEGNFERKELGGVERTLCLEQATGRLLWKHEVPVTYTVSYPAGPRCTPVISGGKVWTLGAEGNLICFDLASGKLLWERALREDYGTKAALWGYAAHPLLDDNRLITLAGGAGSHIVALDKDSGKEVWRSLTAKEQGYSPPTIIEAGGARQLLTLRPDAVSSLEPASGKELWSVPYEATNGSIIMSPVHWRQHLFVAGYSNKSLLLRLADDRPAAMEVWRDPRGKALSPVNVQPFLDGDVLYGFDQGGTLYAVSLPGGERLWGSTDPVAGGRAQQVATAFIVKQGDRFWLFNERGELVIAKLSPQGYQEIDRAKVIEPTGTAVGRSVVWSMPAFAARRAYLRNDQELICVELAATPEQAQE